MIYIIIFYLIGCTLAYFKIVGCLAKEAKATNVAEFLKYYKYTALLVISISWLGFIVGVITYRVYADKYFFKWSVKDHR